MRDFCFEVAIIGGGPAGTATGIALKNLGIDSVFIVEAGTYSKPKIGESIPPNTQTLFQRLNIFDAFSSQHHEPCLGSYSCWGSTQLGFNDNLFNPYGAGWHLDRRRFDLFMARQFKALSGALVDNTRFSNLSVMKNDLYPIKLSFENHPDVCCRFVVDATGQSAKVARKFGAAVSMQDLMVSFAAYFDCQDTHLNENKLTLLEAVEQGWWYCASIPNNLQVVSLTTDIAVAKKLKLKQPENWYSLLKHSKHINNRIEGSAFPNRLNSWKTPSSLLSPPAGNGWLAVGDAAACYDPISSQGIYKALANGLQAAKAIALWLNSDANGLTEYRNKVVKDFVNYLEQRDYFYGQEQRWLEAEFWVKRRAYLAGLKYG
ncbi:NAD(P)/FAD-dependent oxidoreductase [Pseudoalteromonas luteoviolacea]|uniref:NAD(P)/FAD-dependent oxidoreductase n=1 Tax=Pseudoalteromonas luteoviolacea TaxID=43657 RepID=UPI001B38EEFF|nr:tryptophan 7-halogenase [Pseudoalteromonas luteoviolacea]MBQ4835180.1 tryptophan 7-halogenase [Pseudoalteromonas luteoviolacea]